MKGKVIWLVVSCLMALSLVLAACAPKVTEKEEVATKPETVTKPEVVTGETTAAPTAKKAKYSGILTMKDLMAQAAEADPPKYGGTITLALTGSGNDGIIGRFWDDALRTTFGWGLPLNLTHEELLIGDWTMGPAGSGETKFFHTQWAPEGIETHTGSLAESWEIPDRQTLIFKIRRGVYWHDKPPINGREFTANDVVYNIKRNYLNPELPNNYLVNVAPGAKKVTSVSLKPDDPWSVVVKVEDLSQLFLHDISDKLWMHAPEEIAKYGSAKDWKTSQGTGPFMTTDFVPGSSVTMVRNPNYWLTDPIGPGKGNQLPYVDKVIALEIRDLSTRLSAMRTGRIDYQHNIKSEDAAGLRQTNPEIPMLQTGLSGGGLTVRLGSTDPRAIPVQNKRVRQAMSMAIDREAILRDYYRGDGEMLAFFWYPESPYYVPLDKMSETIQKIYSYNPEEARKILAEAGYPNGFKTTMILLASDADYYAILTGYLKKNLNIDVELDIKEPAVINALRNNRTFTAMSTGGGSSLGWPERWMSYGPGDPKAPRNQVNSAEVNDPVINDYITRSETAWNEGKIELRNQIISEAMPYILEQAYYITLPGEYAYNAWQPWLKNNYGTYGIGLQNMFVFAKFAWIDQELKAKIAGKK